MSASTKKVTYGAAMDDLDKFVTELREKQAAEGAPLGGDQGNKDTTHPSKSVDNQEESATEGSRSAENEADISKDVPGVNINDVPADEANAPAAMESITTAADTGDDPSNETGGTKSDKDDPGTTHPAEMDGTENGQKSAAQAADEKLDAAIKEHGLAKVAAELADMVLEETGQTPEQIKAATDAGAQAATQTVEDMVNANVPQIMDNLDKMASDCAAKLLDYYAGIEEQQKSAMLPGEGAPPEEPMPGGAGGEGALPPEDIEQLAAAAGGEVAPEAGAPPEAGMGPGMGPGVGGGGEPGDEEVIEALSAALQEAGITPEELVAAIEAEQGAAPGMAEGGLPIEKKLAHVNTAKEACAEVNSYRNLVAAGRFKHTKQIGRASCRERV